MKIVHVVLSIILLFALSGCIGTTLRVLDMSSGALKHIGKEKSTQYTTKVPKKESSHVQSQTWEQVWRLTHGSDKTPEQRGLQETRH